MLAACASSPARPKGVTTFATAGELPEAPRQPTGVVVDPTPELPVPQEAHRGDSVLVALLPPLPEQSALRVVAAFFRAVVTEDSEALSVLMTADANVSTNGRSPPSAMLDHWRGRLRHFKYQSLAAETLYQTADVESYHFRDLEVVRAGRPPRPAEMVQSDLLLKVPLRVVREGGERMFGDEIVFLLRRSGERFLIRQTIEDFQAQ